MITYRQRYAFAILISLFLLLDFKTFADHGNSTGENSIKLSERRSELPSHEVQKETAHDKVEQVLAKTGMGRDIWQTYYDEMHKYYEAWNTGSSDMNTEERTKANAKIKEAFDELNKLSNADLKVLARSLPGNSKMRAAIEMLVAARRMGLGELLAMSETNKDLKGNPLSMSEKVVYGLAKRYRENKLNEVLRNADEGDLVHVFSGDEKRLILNTTGKSNPKGTLLKHFGNLVKHDKHDLARLALSAAQQINTSVKERTANYKIIKEIRKQSEIAKELGLPVIEDESYIFFRVKKPDSKSPSGKPKYKQLLISGSLATKGDNKSVLDKVAPFISENYGNATHVSIEEFLDQYDGRDDPMIAESTEIIGSDGSILKKATAMGLVKREIEKRTTKGVGPGFFKDLLPHSLWQ